MVERNHKNSPWTEEVDVVAHAMWDAGDSAAVISAAISTHDVGISRNAVIGRAHRKKWEGRTSRQVVRSASRPPRKRGPKPRRPSYNVRSSSMVVMAVAPMPIVKPDVTGMNLVSFADRKADGCCWPIGDPLEPGFGFCDSARIEGSSYCTGHRHESVQYISPSQRHAVRPFRQSPPRR